MVKHFDHLTIVLRDVERAKEFFELLGFKEAKIRRDCRRAIPHLAAGAGTGITHDRAQTGSCDPSRAGNAWSTDLNRLP
jgi:catechol 2,3-dioxygenase-like lactoylglutathione lyase family enzyme